MESGSSNTSFHYCRHKPVVVEEEAFQVGQVRKGVRSKLLDGVVAQVPDITSYSGSW